MPLWRKQTKTEEELNCSLGQLLRLVLIKQAAGLHVCVGSLWVLPPPATIQKAAIRLIG